MKKIIHKSLAIVLCGAMVLGQGPQATTGSRSRAEAFPAAGGAQSVAMDPKQPDPPASYQPLAGQSLTPLGDGRTLVLGGNSGPNVSSAAWVLDASGLAERLPVVLNHARTGHTATLLPNGSVLIVGGFGTTGQVERTAEVYSVVSEKFESVEIANLVPRALHTATLLTDGRVLLAGGTAEAADSIEFFDFRTARTVRVPVPLREGRLGHAARLLPDGSVLLWGGADRYGQELSLGERIDSRGEWTHLESAPGDPRDDVPARVEASIPGDGDEGVSLSPLLSLRFSRGVVPESVSAATVTLASEEGAVPVHVVPAEGGMLAFVTPSATLQSGVDYTLRIHGVRDRDGATLSDAEISFTTSDSARDSAATSSRLFRDANPMSPLLAPPGVTALSGLTRTVEGEPLRGVTFRIDKISAKSDGAGRFLLAGVSPGHHELVIDGRSVPGSASYGVFEVGVDVASERTTVLTYTVWMTALDDLHSVPLRFPTTAETVVESPSLPGLEFHIPPNTTITDIDGKRASEVGITPIPTVRPPFPLPGGVDVPLYFTIQPGGGYLHVSGGGGGRIVYPNVSNSAPGTTYNFWNYDPEDRGWFVYGQGMVSDDGRRIVPNPGVEIYELTGAMVASPDAGPSTGPHPGNDLWDGDPVDPATGLFVYEKTDLYLADVIPIGVTRTYRQNDSRSRGFGIGTTHNYNLFLVGNIFPYTYQELVLPNGGRVRFDRTSPGTSYVDAIYRNTSSPGEYFGATITWNGNGWDLRRRDGLIQTFHDGSGSMSPLDTCLLSIRDRNGNTVDIVRNAFNNDVSRVTSTNGRYIDFTYDTNGRVTHLQDNIGRSVDYTYDPGGRLVQVTDAGGGVWTYAYDPANRMTEIRDARNIQYLVNTYDSGGRVGTQTQADGSTYSFAYTIGGDGAVTQTEITNPRGSVRRIVFNSTPASLNGFAAGGYSGSETADVGGVLERTYSTQRQFGTNLPLSITDAVGRVTTYTYDGSGNPTSVTRLSGTPNAVTSTYTYDSVFGNLTSTTDPLGRTTFFSYDARANLTEITDPLGNRSLFTYNAAGQILSATDANGGVTTHTYVSGNLVSVSDPAGRTLAIAYDGAGRPTAYSHASGVTLQQYSPLGLTTQITDAAGGVTRLTYDANGNILTVTDPRNNTTAYSYDSMDRVSTRTDPLGLTESLQYDGNGNVVQVTDRRGKVSSYTYDALDRLVLAAYGAQGAGNESSVAYIYDAADRLLQAMDSASGTISRDYDGLNRMVQESSPTGTVVHTYDAAGKRTATTVQGQPPILYTYDVASRLTEIFRGSDVVRFRYDPGGRRISQTLPNGVETEYAYTAASDLAGIAFRSGSLDLGNLTYQYDGAGRRSSAGGSLAQVSLPQPLTSAVYNAGNQLSAWNGVPRSYDANGNLLSDGMRSYAWNARNQLASVSGVASASFQYDAFGRRTSKALPGTSRSYLYDGLKVIQELPGGAPAINILNGALDEVLYRTDATGSTGYLADALGSPIALTGNDGEIQTTYSYEPFGKTSAFGAASDNPTQFSGRENDETGLYYYRSRYYDPTSQRFISEDPIGFLGGDANLYGYVGNDPVNLTDPTGQNPLLAACAVGAGYSAVFDVGFSLLSGRKLRPGTLFDDLVDGCFFGMTGFGVGRVLGNVFRGVSAEERGRTVFRQGRFPSQEWDGNYVKGTKWAPENPLTTPDYIQKYGLPAENGANPDWVVRGRIEGPYETGPAPPSPNQPSNLGGATEIIPQSPNSVILDWFHMP